MKCKACLGTGREIDGDQQKEVCTECIRLDYPEAIDCVDCITNCCDKCNGTGKVESITVKRRVDETRNRW